MKLLMAFAHENDLAHSRWSGGTSRLIDIVCLVALIAVVLTVIYGFALRAIWAHGYFIAVGCAIFGALAMMIGLAQQAIAARDAQTWHDMAVWQLDSARKKVMGQSAETLAAAPTLTDTDSPDYYEELVRVFLENVQRDENASIGR